ncbi:MAG: ribonuclease HII, partial [Bacteroidota bacterium]|nr:ribonuclease HII [Bacteroidota bacterium]
FKNLQKKLADENSFLWIGNDKNLINHWKENKAPKNIKNLSDKVYPLSAFQGVAEDEYTHLHFILEKKLPSNGKMGVKNAYTLELDKRSVIPPQWFKNHRTNGMDIVVQDSDNVLYLFSNTGKLYWKKQLSSKIIGEIQRVDLYKNNRWQLAFRTADRMMVLDRNGKIVKPFNIKLPNSSNPLPLSVFDYDNNRNYRFLIAQDRSLLMYNNRGKRLNGFTLKKVGANIIASPKHIRLQSKDYILIPLENNTLKIVSRTGKDRVKVKGEIAFTNNGIYSYLNTFATTDQKGHLIQVDNKGNIVASSLNLKPNHRIDATTKTLVTLSENTLNIKGIPVKLPYGKYTPPKIFYLNNTLYYSTTNSEDQKVYLFYSNGEAVKGFPVYGKSAVDISNSDKDKALEMVVATEENSILIYEIN